MNQEPVIDPAAEAAPATSTVIETPEGQAQIIGPASSTIDLMNQEAVIYGALHSVYDPELGVDVVDLALIRQIEMRPDKVDIRMVLTTPFCPYGPALLEEVRAAVAEATGKETEVHLLAERWDPRDAGLEW